ncbi:MAG TPA: hypothetical protein EYH08_01495 [Pyrodictium sp.]|nr:hypothetical protein [Pyrodictium sp.]
MLPQQHTADLRLTSLLAQLYEVLLSDKWNTVRLTRAKLRNWVTYWHHGGTVAAIAYKLCNALREACKGKGCGKVIEDIEDRFGGFEDLCFVAGFLHDHNKLFKNPDQLRELLTDIVGYVGVELYFGSEEDREELLEAIMAVAEATEGGLTGRIEGMGLSILWPILMTADYLASQESVSDVEELVFGLAGKAYSDAYQLLRRLGLVIGTISVGTGNLLTAMVSKDIVEILRNRGWEPLAIYYDGIAVVGVENSSTKLTLREIAEAFTRELKNVAIEIDENKVKTLLGKLLKSRNEVAAALESFVKAKVAEKSVDEESNPKRLVALIAALHALDKIGFKKVYELASRRLAGYQPAKLGAQYIVGKTTFAKDFLDGYGVSNVMELLRRLAIESPFLLTDLIAKMAAKFDKTRKPRYSKKLLEELLKANSLQPSLAARLPDKVGLIYSLALSLAARVVIKEGPEKLVEIVEKIFGIKDVERVVEEFALDYVTGRVSGTIVVPDRPSTINDAAGYCVVCRTPLRKSYVEGMPLFKVYGDVLRAPKGVVELWVSDDPPLADLDASSSPYVMARRICLACLYEASRIGGFFPPLTVYALHPAVALEQLVLEQLLLEALNEVFANREYRIDKAFESVYKTLKKAQKRELSVEQRMVIDYLGARMLVPFPFKERETSMSITVSRASKFYAFAGPVLYLLGGGQLAVASSLAELKLLSRRPVSAGIAPTWLTTILELLERGVREQAEKVRNTYRAVVDALLAYYHNLTSFRLEDADEAYSLLEAVSADPIVALLYPLILVREERDGRRYSPAPYSNVFFHVHRLEEVLKSLGVREKGLTDHLYLYAVTLYCSLPPQTRQSISKYHVQSPLREALNILLDYKGVLDSKSVKRLAVDNAVSVLKRRLAPQGLSLKDDAESKIRRAIEGVLDALEPTLSALAPSKARRLAEAVLDSAYETYRILRPEACTKEEEKVKA